jgi:hypothetical protein
MHFNSKDSISCCTRLLCGRDSARAGRTGQDAAVLLGGVRGGGVRGAKELERGGGNERLGGKGGGGGGGERGEGR